MLRLENVTRTFGPLKALDGIGLTLERGSFTAVRGPSGSGKSTLLFVLGLLDRPTGGRYLLDGRNVLALGDREASRLRNRTFGFVFQQFHLHADLTALENVARPLAFRGVKGRERRQAALAALEDVGLAERATHRPGQLSGGEQQRVAVARALAGNPGVILADEPTGNLPRSQWEPVLELLARAHGGGTTVVLVTHDDGVAAWASKSVYLEDGRLVA